MSFAELLEVHRQLALRLRARVGDAAFQEITVSVPVRDCDEVSFVRLVVWCYALVNESGRVSLRFLRELPPLAGSDLLSEAGHLRTWATHNLLPERDADRKRLLLAWQWLKTACGTDRPATDTEWRSCFDQLVKSAAGVLDRALAASDALASVEDGPHLREELIRRLNRDWDAHRFDAVVAVVAGRLGFLGVDAAKLRARHLESWRKVVAVADDAGISSLLERRIEKDLLDLMNDALPASALDYLGVVPAWQPADLGALMLAIRASRGDGLSAVDILTRALATLPDGGTEARGQIER